MRNMTYPQGTKNDRQPVDNLCVISGLVVDEQFHAELTMFPAESIKNNNLNLLVDSILCFHPARTTSPIRLDPIH